ncbi:hypothetical protein BL254_10485 [Protofrankia sp. BMG5.30]|uniref:Prohead serine protease n=2 Tax=Frankiaceae TaxID=74712 RepID=A0ABR5F4E1_9ACTN|nr:hypothetical protein FrCorBMG51_11090 [Protofrankia coriariae]ONH35708.1 hypothetical protein BL254_10485 [Protofrankia sp. BMG5.30]
MRHYVRGYVQRADNADTKGPLRIIAATEGRKPDGLNLTMDGARLGRFQANPVVGYGHMYWGRDGLPIGRSDKTWIDDGRLMMDIVFDDGDDFARTVERKYRAGIMNAFSIGFDAWNIGKDGVPEGWELYEVSAVPLPMDPDAIVESGRAGDQLALVRALGELRAGAVLSKANKKLVQDAVAALAALLDAAGGTDDDDEDGRHTGPDRARLLRLAGL